MTPEQVREVLARVMFPDAFRDADAARAMLATIPSRSPRWIQLDGPAMRRVADAYAAVDRGLDVQAAGDALKAAVGLDIDLRIVPPDPD